MLWSRETCTFGVPQCVPHAFIFGSTSTAGKLHPNINLDDPEDAVDTSILVGPQPLDLDIKVGLIISSHTMAVLSS